MVLDDESQLRYLRKCDSLAVQTMVNTQKQYTFALKSIELYTYTAIKMDVITMTQLSGQLWLLLMFSNVAIFGLKDGVKAIC